MCESQRDKLLFMNNQGFTLVGVLMVLVVFSVLGLSITAIASNSVKTSSGERDDQSVFYIAEAGATVEMVDIEKAVADIYANTKTKSDFFNALNLRILAVSKPSSAIFEDTLGKETNAKIDVEELNIDNPREYKVTSVGKIDNKTRTVSQKFIVNYIEGNGITIPAGVGVFAKDGMEIKNGTVNGDLLLNSAVGSGIGVPEKGWPTINGKIIIPYEASTSLVTGPIQWLKQKAPPIVKHNENYVFPLPPFPDFPSYKVMENKSVSTHPVIQNGNINITNSVVENYILKLEDNYEFNNITFNSNRNLTFDIGDKDISIVVNRIQSEIIGNKKQDGNLYIKGTGTLTMYIKDNIDLKGKDFNSNGINNLFIYIGRSEDPENPKTFEKPGHGSMNASIFAADAIVSLTGGAKFFGNIITGGPKVTIPGGTSAQSSSTVVYAPNAHVKVDGSGSLSGAVVSKTFELDGGASITGKDIDFEDVPFFSRNGGASEATLQKLILKET